MAKQPTRMQVATRIHFELLRELGQGVDIERMLQQPRYARDVLLVCDAYPGSELADLAMRFRLAPATPYPVADGGHAAHPIEWSRASTGFGVSKPMSMTGPDSEVAHSRPAPEQTPDAAKPQPKQALRDLLARWLHR